jgi:hypothetical protein
VTQRATLGRVMDSRRKLLFRGTSMTLQVVVEAVMDRHIRIRIHHRMPQVTAVAEVEGDSIFPAFRVNSRTFSVAPGSEEERAPRTYSPNHSSPSHSPNLAPMPHLMHLLIHRTATDRIGLLIHQSPVRTNLNPVRRHMHHHTHHRTHRAAPSHLGEVISPLTINPHDSSGLVVGPEDTVETLGVGSGAV